MLAAVIKLMIHHPSILASQKPNSPQEKLLKTSMPSWRNYWMEKRTKVRDGRWISPQKNFYFSFMLNHFSGRTFVWKPERREEFWGCFSFTSDWIWRMFRREEISSSRTEKVRKSVTLNQQPSDWSLNTAKKRSTVIIIIVVVFSRRSVCFRCCPVFLGGSSVLSGVGTVTSKRCKLISCSKFSVYSVRTSTVFISETPN